MIHGCHKRRIAIFLWLSSGDLLANIFADRNTPFFRLHESKYFIPTFDAWGYFEVQFKISLIFSS